MQKLTNAEVAAVVALKNAGLETTAEVPWMVYLKKGKSVAHFAYDPQAGIVIAHGDGEFASWRLINVKFLAKAGAPGKFTAALFATSAEQDSVEGYFIGENKAVEPAYLLAVIGRKKAAISATVIERSDGKAVHQICTTYTHKSAWELENLLSTVGFFAATTLSDIHLLMKGDVANVGK